MTAYCLSGIIFGLFAGLSPGPLMVLVVSETLTRGVRAGVRTALAPLITDAPIIIGASLALDRLKDIGPALGAVSLCGACYLLYLAREGWKSSGVDFDVAGTAPASRGLLKGITTNLLNPHPYLFWVTLGAPTMLKAAGHSPVWAMIFLAFFYACIVGSKIAVALLVGVHRQRFKRYYLVIQRALCAMLVIFSVIFFYDAAAYWGLWRN